MNNRERTKKQDTLHLYVAIRRNKENSDGQEICFREVIRDNKTSLDALEARIKSISGTWRIYKTVNSRDIEKARVLLLMKLIENPENSYKVDTIWKTCLLQPKCRAEHKLLWDVDGNITLTDLGKIFSDRKVFIKQYIKSPNGYNVVTELCDTRLFKKEDIIKEYSSINDFGFSRDGVMFIKRFVIENERNND